jgi:hypothetical protein
MSGPLPRSSDCVIHLKDGNGRRAAFTVTGECDGGHIGENRYEGQKLDCICKNRFLRAASSRRYNLQDSGRDHAGPWCGLECNECLPDKVGAARRQISQIDETAAADFDEARQPSPAQLIGLHDIDDGTVVFRRCTARSTVLAQWKFQKLRNPWKPVQSDRRCPPASPALESLDSEVVMFVRKRLRWWRLNPDSARTKGSGLFCSTIKTRPRRCPTHSRTLRMSGAAMLSAEPTACSAVILPSRSKSSFTVRTVTY